MLTGEHRSQMTITPMGYLTSKVAFLLMCTVCKRLWSAVNHCR